jgi:hypothetical protein
MHFLFQKYFFTSKEIFQLLKGNIFETIYHGTPIFSFCSILPKMGMRVAAKYKML